MIQKTKKWSFAFIAIQACFLCTPTDAIFGFGGGGGDADVTEILAAGLITKMLMEDFSHGGSSSSMFQSLRHSIVGGYSAQPEPRPHYHHMVAPRRPMMLPYPLPPPMALMHRHHHHFMMNQAMIHQARHRAHAEAQAQAQAHVQAQAQAQAHAQAHVQAQAQAQAQVQALTYPWNPSYRGLQGSESFVTAFLPALSTIDELMSDEAAISAATFILNSGLLDSDDEHDEREEEQPLQQEEQPPAPTRSIDYETLPTPRTSEAAVYEEQEEIETKPHDPEDIETASSDHESRYILPRIVRHFVQRIMRRVEHH